MINIDKQIKFNYSIRMIGHRFWPNDRELNDMEIWCTENLEGNFKLNYSQMNFELESDALAFKLRWL